MRTFARKQRSAPQTDSAGSAAHRRTFFAQNHAQRSLLRFQRKIGNQAVQRLIRRNAKKFEENPVPTASTRIKHDLGGIPRQVSFVKMVQSEPTINEPADKYEQEADRVASVTAYVLSHNDFP